MPAISPFGGLPAASSLAETDEFLLAQRVGNKAQPRRATLDQVREAISPAIASRKSATLTAPASDERIALFFSESAATVTALHAAVAGPDGAAVAFHVRFGPSLTGGGTSVVTAGITCPAGGAGLTVPTLDVTAIPAASWVWLDVGAVTGDVAAFHVTLAF